MCPTLTVMPSGRTTDGLCDTQTCGCVYLFFGFFFFPPLSLSRSSICFLCDCSVLSFWPPDSLVCSNPKRTSDCMRAHKKKKTTTTTTTKASRCFVSNPSPFSQNRHLEPRGCCSEAPQRASRPTPGSVHYCY